MLLDFKERKTGNSGEGLWGVTEGASICHNPRIPRLADGRLLCLRGNAACVPHPSVTLLRPFGGCTKLRALRG